MKKPRVRKITKFNDLQDVENYVETLLSVLWKYDKYLIGLDEYGYTFVWDNRSRKRIGYCHYERKEIGLARKIIELNLQNSKIIREVVLHEIAHAINFELFDDTGHTESWRNVLLYLGGNGKTLYKPHGLNFPLTKYTMKCLTCGIEVGYVVKPKPKSCAICDPSSYNEKFKMKLIKNY